MTKLKPCPFCGGEAKAYKYAGSDKSIWVGCKNCQIGTPRTMPERAIELWNRRVEQKSCLNAYWLGEKRRENE